MVIGTDCIGSCRTNYHTITATTPQYLSYAPFNRIEYVDDNNDTLNIWYNLFNEILNKHAPIVTRRAKRNLYNNLNGIIQKFSMQGKWEINLKKTWKLDTENDLKVDKSINIANTYNKFFISCHENIKT